MSESPEVTQPPEAPLLDQLHELDRRITGSVERVVRELHHELGERVRRSNQELLRLVEEFKPEIPSSFVASTDLAPIAAQAGSSAGRRAVHELLGAAGRIDAATTQADVLAVLIEEARRFSSRAAFFLTRPTAARGWASRGFGSDTAIESVEVEPGGLAGLDQLHLGHGPVELGSADRAALARWLQAPAAAEAVLIPFVVRGRLGGALYADQLEGGSLQVGSLQLLTYNAALALETLTVRAPGVSPTLRTGSSQDGGAQSLVAWEPGASPASTVAAATVATGAAAAGAAVATGVAAVVASVVHAAEPEAEVYEPAEHEAVSEAAGFAAPATDFEVEAPVVEHVEEAIAPEPVFFEEPASAVEETSAELEPPAIEAAEIEPVMFEEPEPPAILETFPGSEPEPAEVELFEPAVSPTADIAEPAAELEDYGVAEPALEPYRVEDSGFEIGGLEDRGVADHGVADHGVADHGVADRGVADRGVADRGVEDIGVEDYAVEDIAVEDYGVEDIGVTMARPTQEVAADADLWPADEEEMPAVDFAPSVAEVSPIEPIPMELVDDVPEIEEPAVAYPDFPVGQQTVRLDVSAFQQTPPPAAKVMPVGPEDPTLFRSTAEVPTWEVEEPVTPVESIDYELEAETTPYEPITEAVPTSPPTIVPPPVVAPPVASEDPTILGSRAALGISPPPAAPAPAPPPSVAPPSVAPPSVAPPVTPAGLGTEPDAEPAGSTQVQPPSDVSGPGLAFAAAGGAAGHDALHEEARRLARLLVSEIKLYNEEIIEQGKREGNIYDRLREDVDRSRQMYEERIDPRIRGGEDYFYQELVQRLAGGDPRLLGM